MPPDDHGTTGGERPSDKLNDKPGDKLAGTDPGLARVIQAWTNLPQAIREAILALVRAGKEGS